MNIKKYFLTFIVLSFLNLINLNAFWADINIDYTLPDNNITINEVEYQRQDMLIQSHNSNFISNINNYYIPKYNNNTLKITWINSNINKLIEKINNINYTWNNVQSIITNINLTKQNLLNKSIELKTDYLLKNYNSLLVNSTSTNSYITINNVLVEKNIAWNVVTDTIVVKYINPLLYWIIEQKLNEYENLISVLNLQYINLSKSFLEEDINDNNSQVLSWFNVLNQWDLHLNNTTTTHIWPNTQFYKNNPLGEIHTKWLLLFSWSNQNNILSWIILDTNITKILWLSSATKIDKQIFTVLWDYNKYTFLKFKLNIFSDIVATHNTEQYDLKAWLYNILFKSKWNWNWYDVKIVSLLWKDEFNISTDWSHDIIFSDYVWFLWWNYRLQNSLVYNSFKQSILNIWTYLWDELNVDANNNVTSPTLKHQQFKKIELSRWKINIESKLFDLWINYNGKVSRQLTWNNSKNLDIYVSPFLWKYFDNSTFNTIQWLKNIIDLSEDDLNINTIISNDNIINYLNTWNVNLSYVTSWTVTKVDREIASTWLNINWKMREYWMIHPWYTWLNEWTEYTRWLILVFWKLVSIDSNWNGKIYIFPLIDQDWWLLLWVWWKTNSLYYAKNINTCWFNTYTCNWKVIEKDKYYSSQYMDSFMNSVDKYIKNPSTVWYICSITTNTTKMCVRNAMEPPTTVFIGDTRKWLQEVLMNMFTVDPNQTKIEEAIKYKHILSIPQYWSNIIKVNRWEKTPSWQDINYYVKPINLDTELLDVQTRFPNNIYWNIIITKDNSDFDKVSTTKKWRLKSTPTALLTGWEIKNFFTYWLATTQP